MALRIGQSQLRYEDDTLIRGAGSYVADDPMEGEVAIAFVRSQVAAGAIKSLDVSAAMEAPGVLAVLTGEDAATDKLTGFTPRLKPPTPHGGDLFVPLSPPLRTGHVRHVGDLIAAVVAETRAQAEAAAELVYAEIDPLPAATTAAEAAAEGAPLVWDEVPGNIAFIGEQGDKAKVEAAFASAAHVVAQRFPITRVSPVCMEPRGIVARFDPANGTFTVRLGTQATHRMGQGISAALGLDPSAVRVISHQCGGSFGMRNNPFAEEVVTCYAAQKVGRPVRWNATRAESFMSDAHAREMVVDAELALDAEGHFLAMRVTSLPSVGAYYGIMSTQPLFGNLGGLAGVYKTPAIHVTVKGVHTNTQCIGPYRGAGRPEMTYVMERMADLAAKKLGLDRVEIRRRNMIEADQMPFKTGLVFTYDSGDFPTVMTKTLEAADWAGFPARREEARKRGKLRGIGISNPIEVAGGPANAPQPEFAELTITADGKYVAMLGSNDSGQGHITTFRQILGDRFDVEPEDISIVTGDTGIVPKGTGTFGSRTVGAAGTSLAVAGDQIIEEAKKDAANALEASPEDIVFERGTFTIAGTDRRITLTELAAKKPEGYSAEHNGATEAATFPNGCHICEVEIDPDTGVTDVVRYTVVDDVGVMVNPLLVKGQIHGGIVQGLGQVFGEEVVYDENGQLITASFMDYYMPHADAVPSFDIGGHGVPTKVNRLGVKGAGEAGTVGALAVGISAVADALGVDHIDMPATPERVWRAIRETRRAG
jgi:carbon-monoxide dehydrogenase large subunit